MLGAEIRVLLGAALLGGDVDHEPVSVDGDRHPGHLLVVEELVERVARLGVRLALVERLGLPDVRPRDGDERVRAGLLLGLLERLVREVPALGLDERLSGVHELPGRVRAVRAEHLGVYLGALLPEAHLDERLRELRLRVLRLAGLGELLGEAVQRVLGLLEVAERRVDRAEADVRVRGVHPLGIRVEVRLVALCRVPAEVVELRLGLRHAPPAVADEEERLLLEGRVLRLVRLRERRVGERLVGGLRELAELLDAADDLRGAGLERGVHRLLGLVRLRPRDDVEALLLVHLRERHPRLLLHDPALLDLDVLLHGRDRLGALVELGVAVGLLREGGRVVDGVGVVLLDEAAELDRVRPALGLHRLAEHRGRGGRRAHVAAVVDQERAVEAVGARELPALLLARRDPEDRVARHRHDLAVADPREALGEVPLDRVRVDSPVGRLRGLLVRLDEVEVAAHDLLDGVDGLLDLGIAPEHLEVLRDRLLGPVLGHLLGRRAELHLAHLRELVLRDRRLDLRAVVLLRELADLLGHLARVGRPGGLGVEDEDVERVVERAEVVALAGAALLAEQERLDALVVALGLLVLRLRLLPEHLREHEAAERHRRELPQALLAVGVELHDLLVELLELAHVLVDRLLRLRDVAPEELDVRLHRDRAAEVHRTVHLPQQLVDDLLRGVEERPALLDVLLVRRELEVHLRRLARHVAPRVRVVVALLLVDELEEPLVDLDRLREALVADEDLPPGVARLHVELAYLLRGLGERLEELVVYLRALRLLAAEEQVVRDLEPRGPVLRALAVGKRRDLRLGLLELA